MTEEDKHQRYGKCRIDREIGRGAKSVVYLGWHEALNIPVAVKVIQKQGGQPGGPLSMRVMREARIAAQLSHPSIVRIFDCGETADSYYLIFEYVEGVDCLERIGKDGPFEWRRAVQITREVAEGLGYACSRGVIHRDLKPQNIMIDNEGSARLTDLGLAKVVGPEEAAATLDGAILGTPYYMSPEQVRQPADVDFRADIYSLGATLYHLTTGSFPFHGKTSYEIMSKHLNEPVPSPRKVNPDLPEPLCAVVMRTMAKSPEERHQSYEELIRDFDELLGQRVPVPADTAAPQESPQEQQAVPQQEGKEEPCEPAAPPIEDIPATEQDFQARLRGMLALLVSAFVLVCFYHFLLRSSGPSTAAVALAAALLLSAGWSCLVLRRGSSGAMTEASRCLDKKVKPVLDRLCQRLALPTPRVHISGWLDDVCFAYSLSARKASVSIPREWLEETSLYEEEPEAVAALCVAGVCCGDSHTRMLLAAPLELLKIGRSVLRGVLRFLCSLSPKLGLGFAQALTVAGTAVVVAGIAFLFWISVWGGVLALLFLCVLLVVAAFERSSRHAEDAVAAKLTGKEDTVRLLVASLPSCGNFYRLSPDYVASGKSRKNVWKLSRDERRELAEKVAPHFSEVQCVQGLLERVRESFSPIPSAAKRINRLAGIGGSHSVAAAVAISFTQAYTTVSGGGERDPINMQELSAVGFYEVAGAIAGAVAVAALAFLASLGRAHYAMFLALVNLSAVALGLVLAGTARSLATPASRSSWGIIVTSVFFTCTSMLGLCLFGGKDLSEFALQFPTAFAIFGFLTFFVGALFVRVTGTSRKKAGLMPEDAEGTPGAAIAAPQGKADALLFQQARKKPPD